MGREGVKGLDRRAASGVMLTLLLVGFLAVTINVSVVEAGGTVYIRADGSVDPSSAPISTVDNVTYTLTGNIYDFIVVERDNIVLDGAGYTVQGTGNGTGIYLSGRSNVTVKNTTVTEFNYGIYLHNSSGCTISGNTANNNSGGFTGGIYLNYSSGCTISNNTANNNIGVYIAGIYLAYSSGCTVSDNTANNNMYFGIFLYPYCDNCTVSGNNANNDNRAGIYLVHSSGCTVSDNTANNDYYYGESGIRFFNCVNCTVSGNSVKNATYAGIYLTDSSGCTVSGNTANNNRYGIHLYNSFSNNFYHNNFISNTQNAYSYNSINTWDDGYPSGGNYWSNYTGVDNYCGPYQNWMGSDGIGDTPYVIDANNRDNYPLMAPWPPNGTWTAPHNARAVYPGLGWHINITVFLQNQGNETETFNVTAYYDSQTIGNQTVEVVPGVWRTLTFTWDTTGIAPCEYNYTSDQYIPYTINVNVSTPTLGETTWYHGTVTVRRFGDANGDGHCDGFDFTMLNLCWLTVYPDERYNPNADFNGDDSIDGFDYTHINLKWLTY